MPSEESGNGRRNQPYDDYATAIAKGLDSDLHAVEQDLPLQSNKSAGIESVWHSEGDHHPHQRNRRADHVGGKAIRVEPAGCDPIRYQDHDRYDQDRQHPVDDLEGSHHVAHILGSRIPGC